MTISGALSNAMSGLQAASRATQIISSNLSNALTDGYGVRSLQLSSQATGGNGGVRVDGVMRNVDPVVVGDRQLSSAQYENRRATLDFMSNLERLVGVPGQEGALTQQIANFESSLITAASRPDATDRLETAVNSAKNLANTINKASSGIQDQRSRADNAISSQVKRLNDALSELERFNSQVASARIGGKSDVAYLDNRQKLVDEISKIVPVKLVPRANGRVALFTTGGAILIDGSAVEIGFEPANLISYGMTLAAGDLSGLTLNGRTIKTGSEDGALRGGSLSAQFEIRDQLAPDAQNQLDAVARDIVERFETFAPIVGGVTQAGLFTDNGNSFDDLNETGLAGRIEVNQIVDVNQGGAAWKIRDGLDAIVPGDVGDATLLQAMGDALNIARTPGSGGFGSGSFSALNLSTTMLSVWASDQLNTEQALSFTATQLTELTQLELADGVDTDAELQRLILIEQAYAANARMIKTVDEMMQTLLRF